MRSQLLHYATVCAASAVALLVSAAPAAGDAGPHHASATIVTDSCAGCHRVHTAKAPRLLKEAQSSLCYACHGSGATGSSEDVVNGIGYSSGPTGASKGALRGGGFEFALIDSDNPSGHDSEGVIPTLSTDEPGEPVNSTHSVDPTTPQTAWGFGAVGTDPTNYGKQISLSCGSCHDPHGNGNYRILRTTPRGLFTHTQEENGEAAEVAIPDTLTKVYTTSNYWLADDVNAAGFAPNIAAWCSTCHTRYLSTTGASASTPTGDAVFAYRHTSNKTGTGAGQRNCVQCHVAHGSNSTMDDPKSQSVPFPGGIAGGGTDSRLLRVDSRGVCKLCHEEK